MEKKKKWKTKRNVNLPKDPHSPTDDNSSWDDTIADNFGRYEVLLGVSGRLDFHVFIYRLHPKSQGWRAIHDDIDQQNLQREKRKAK